MVFLLLRRYREVDRVDSVGIVLTFRLETCRCRSIYGISY